MGTRTGIEDGLRREPGRAGRRHRVPGGYPYSKHITLSAADGELLENLALVDGMSPGAYASMVVERHLQARPGATLSLTARHALGELVGLRSTVAGLAQAVDMVGRLVNQIARHTNTHRALPAGGVMGRVGQELEVLRIRVSGTLTELDTVATVLRRRL